MASEFNAQHPRAPARILAGAVNWLPGGRAIFRFSIRDLLLVTAVVAIVLAGYLRYERLERRARLHLQQAELVAESRGILNSASWVLGPQAWDDYDRQERLHRQLAAEYRQKIWRPWMRVREPSPPLPHYEPLLRTK